MSAEQVYGRIFHAQFSCCYKINILITHHRGSIRDGRLPANPLNRLMLQTVNSFYVYLSLILLPRVTFINKKNQQMNINNYVKDCLNWSKISTMQEYIDNCMCVCNTVYVCICIFQGRGGGEEVSLSKVWVAMPIFKTLSNKSIYSFLFNNDWYSWGPKPKTTSWVQMTNSKLYLQFNDNRNNSVYL